jgi:hypothetical protein
MIDLFHTVAVYRLSLLCLFSWTALQGAVLFVLVNMHISARLESSGTGSTAGTCICLGEGHAEGLRQPVSALWLVGVVMCVSCC